MNPKSSPPHYNQTHSVLQAGGTVRQLPVPLSPDKGDPHISSFPSSKSPANLFLSTGNYDTNLQILIILSPFSSLHCEKSKISIYISLTNLQSPLLKNSNPHLHLVLKSSNLQDLKLKISKIYSKK